MRHRYVAKDGRTISLRPAVEGDAAELLRAADSVAREGIYFLRSRFEMEVDAERAFLEAAQERGDLILIARMEGLLVGWVSLLRSRAEFQRHTAELGIGVLEGHRGLGVGSALMDFSLKWACDHGLEKVKLGVRASNTRAQALYRRLGFVEEGLRVCDVKDLNNRYDDIVELAWFCTSLPTPHGVDQGTQV